MTLARIVARFDSWLAKMREQRLKSHFAVCGKRVTILPNVYIWSPGKLRVGNDVCIHSFCHIMARGGITIGNWVQVASHVSITTLTHRPDERDFERTVGVDRPIRIGNGVWIGTSAVILAGVTIGEHAVVAAGAVVTRDVPAHTLVAGVPARVIRELLTSSTMSAASPRPQ